MGKMVFGNVGVISTIDKLQYTHKIDLLQDTNT